MNLKLRMRVASHNLTWLLGTRFPKSIPLVFVVGYPKSGSTRAAQLVSHCLELPYPRHASWSTRPGCRRCRGIGVCR